MSAYILPVMAISAALSSGLAYCLLMNHRQSKATVRDLRLCEEKFLKVFRSSPDWVTLSYLDGGIYIDVNDAFCRDTGYSREDVLGKSSLEFGLWADKSMRRRMVDELSSRGSLRNWELEFRTKSGEHRTILRSAELITIAGKDCIIAVNKDITERKDAEISVCKSEEKYRSLFEESKDVIFVSIPEGRFIDINRAGVELFRYPSREELLKANIPEDIYLNPRERIQYLGMIDREGFVKDYEINFKTRDGEKITALITSTAVRDETGRMIAVRGVIRDISAHKMLEAQLRQAQKMEAVGQLAGGIAHDFNNILTTILGYADLLKGRFQTGDPAIHYLDELLESAERASILTHSLLAFSRKQLLNIAPVDINYIIGKVETLLSRIIGEDIELRTDLSEGELCVMADSAQLEQVLMNLSANARDAMPDGGTLTIRTALFGIDEQFVETYKYGTPGNCAIISVSDSGTGMDATTREKIFEPFFTTKEVGKGTGLGLAMAYGIIKQHDGFIDVSSQPGQGSTFRILLPLTSEAAIKPYVAGAKTEMTREAPISGGTILVAEDNDSVRKLAKIVLEKSGFKVIEAVDGEDAVTKFIQHRDAVNLVVLDIIMPRKNGRQVYEEIRRLEPGVKVLLTSGYTSDVLRKKGFVDDMPELLLKPVSPRELLKKTREMLGR